MATTFLQLANRVIRRINEVELSTVSSQRGVSAFVLDAINDTIRQINAAENEWPFNYTAQTQELVSGQALYTLNTSLATVDWQSFFLRPLELTSNGSFTSNISGWTDLSTGTGAISYVSTGNGRLNLNAGAAGFAGATQGITTVVDTRYRVRVKTYGGTITIGIGTTSGDDDVYTDDLVINNLNRGQFTEFYFTAESTTTYITFSHSSNASYQVDYVSVNEDFEAVHLCYVGFDYWKKYLQADDFNRAATAYERPRYVFKTQAGQFGVSPIPKLEYYVEFDAWQFPAALASDSDTIQIPDKYSDVIVDGALYQCYMFKEDFEQAGISKSQFDKGIKQMRTQLINRPDSMEGSKYGV